MSRRTCSIERAVYLYVVLPVAALVFLVVGLLGFVRYTNFHEERVQYTEKINAMVSSIDPGRDGQVDEIEFMREERNKAQQQEFVKSLVLLLVVVLLGLVLPFFAIRHFARRLQANLELFNDHIANAGKGGSALMPQTFDFVEFDRLAVTLRQVTRHHSETKQRWELAEKELISANADLVAQAEELKQGRKIALSMMEDADNSKRELEATNQRLNLVIEQAKQSAHEADSANRAKSDFLATMSHEIRTPLNGIIGFVEMLHDTKLDEEQEDYLHTIRSSGEALMSLINDVLDFSKVESGKLMLESRSFSLLPTIRGLSSMFFTQATEKGLSLVINVDEDVPKKIRGDETRLRQVLINLLSNAIKFTPRGEVSLHVSTHRLDLENKIAELEFEVRDTGIGMSREQIGQLFKPFSQGDSSTTRKYGGTGLGLAICKRLSEAMGGKVWATSLPGEGSSFFSRVRVEIISLRESGSSAPIEIEAVKEQRQREESVASSQSSEMPGDKLPLKIAVAEDNMANQRVIMIMLRRLGWTTEFADNGEELLELVQDRDFDLIFMDLQMPKMDGLEATRLIRAGHGGEKAKNAKIIALTANALAGDEARCLEIGMDGYLSKPLKLSKLKQTVLQLYNTTQA